MLFRARNIQSYAFGETVADFCLLLFGAKRMSAYCASFGTFRKFRLFVETLGDAAYFGARFETLGPLEAETNKKEFMSLAVLIVFNFFAILWQFSLEAPRSNFSSNVFSNF